MRKLSPIGKKRVAILDEKKPPQSSVVQVPLTTQLPHNTKVADTILLSNLQNPNQFS